MSTRRFFVGALVASLLVAGVASYYASSHPDGLEYVAEQTGFIDAAVGALERRNTLTLSMTERRVYLELNGTTLTSEIHDQRIDGTAG